MADMAALSTRLAAPDVALLPDWAAADVLNRPDPVNGTKRVDVAVSDVRGALLASGEWPSIVLVAEGVELPSMVEMDAPTKIALRGLCILVRDTLTLTMVIQTTVQARYEATVSALNGLVGAGLLSSVTRDALLAMADQPRSWAEANDITTGVTARDVGLARGGVA